MGVAPKIKLKNGVEIPQVGFGVYQIPRSKTTEMVRKAFDVGYRLIDTAEAYGNEKEVGRAVLESGLDRGQVFVTTKLHPQNHGYDSTIAAFEESLRNLRMEYIDLYLLHWPSPGREKYLESWQACEKLLAEGKVRFIGVSNLSVSQLDWLLTRTETIPAVNQIELHPNVQQAKLREFHQAHGILTEAWSPIAQGRSLRDPILNVLAKKYQKSAAQVILRWHLQLGNVALSKSATPSRIKENFDIFDFEIVADDMKKITALDGDPGGAPSRTIAAGFPMWQP
jgi:2,5-diketo-D-gluconate reductase A